MLLYYIHDGVAAELFDIISIPKKPIAGVKDLGYIAWNQFQLLEPIIGHNSYYISSRTCVLGCLLVQLKFLP